MEANSGLIEELRVVFDACEGDVDGKISLSELANLSRSHTDNQSNQVEKLLEIFNLGDNDADDRIDFQEFCQRMIKFMNIDSDPVDDDTFKQEDEGENDIICGLNDVKLKNRYNSSGQMHFSPTLSDQGAFNENLKRSFEKTRSSVTSSPNVSGPKIMKRKPSQSRLLGNIPLVNTSSEDEAEDSFDRKIASSLAFARPMELQPQHGAPPQYLVRGNSLRTTVMRKQKSGSLSPNIESSRSRPSQMYPESDSSSRSSSASSDRSGTSSPFAPVSNHHQNISKLNLNGLDEQVALLTKGEIGGCSGSSSSVHQNHSESHSSGVDSLKMDLEDELSTSIQLVKKHGEERLDAERRRHSDQMDSIDRERELERKNFHFKYEMLQDEKEEMKKEIQNLKDKVGLLNVEKTLLEEQMMENVHRAAAREEADSLEDLKRKDLEEELTRTVQNLSERVADQDQELAEIKEANIILKQDNIILKKQVKELQLKESKSSGFRIFGSTGKENISSGILDDPQDIRMRLRFVEKQLKEQVEANKQLKQYVGDVLVNVMSSNPQILEKN